MNNDALVAAAFPSKHDQESATGLFAAVWALTEADMETFFAEELLGKAQQICRETW